MGALAPQDGGKLPPPPHPVDGASPSHLSLLAVPNGAGRLKRLRRCSEAEVSLPGLPGCVEISSAGQQIVRGECVVPTGAGTAVRNRDLAAQVLSARLAVASGAGAAGGRGPDPQQSAPCRKRLLELSLAPASQRLPRRAAASMSGATHQYVRVATLALSQQARLFTSGKLRRRSGYDLEDPFLNEEFEDEAIAPGSPVRFVGEEGAVAAYAGPDNAKPGCHFVRPAGSGSAAPLRRLHRDEFLVLPTRPPESGEWVFLVGLGGAQASLNGACGICGPSVRRGREVSFWVTLQRHAGADSEAADDLLAPPEALLLPARSLAALPAPPPGAALSPLAAPAAAAMAGATV